MKRLNTTHRLAAPFFAATPLSPTTDGSKLRFRLPLPRRPPIISRVNAFVAHVVAAIVRSRLVDFMPYVLSIIICDGATLYYK